MEGRIMRRRIRRGIIGIALACAMVVGMYPEAVVQAEGEVSEAVQTYFELCDGYWEADETFWNAWEEFYGNEEIGKKGALTRYQEAGDTDESTIYSLYEEAVSVHTAIITAYETATEKYNTVKEKYEELSEEDKPDAEEVYNGVTTCYGNIMTDYANLETPDKPGLTIYFKAASIYMDALDAYWNAMDSYYGNEEKGTEGALEKYNKALESGESIVTITKLYQEASEVHSVVLAAYETITEKYNAVIKKYNALSEDEKASVEDYADVENSYKDVKSGYDGLDTPQALNISSKEQITGTVSGASLNTGITELLDRIGLEDEEKEKIYQGEQTKVILSVDGATPTEKEKELIATKLGEYGIGQYLNLELQLEIGDYSRNITEMTKPVSITITVPEKLVNKDTAKERTYRILRLHNGTVDVVDAVYDAANNKLTFETDRFSVYALIYKDTVVTNDTGTEQDTPQALNISSETQITGTVSGASLNTGITELLDRIGLEDEEKEKIYQGEQTKVILSVDGATPTEKEKELIATKLGEYGIGQYLNLELQLEIGDYSRNITEMTKPVSITITVPEKLVNKDTAKERTYRILRLHNGTVDVVDAVYDATSNKLTFETDRFSVYALIYKDTVISNTTGTEQSDSNTSGTQQSDSNTSGTQQSASNTSGTQQSASDTQATTATVTAPKTGDNSPVMESMMLLLVAVAILGVYAKRRKEFFWIKRK